MGRRLDRTVSGSAFKALSIHWIDAPPERSALFTPTFSAIAVEIQRKLRERVPQAYFSRTSQFATTRYAYPVLIYMASRPYRAKDRSDFAYDVLNQDMMAGFFRMLRPNLGSVLSAAGDRLRSEGRLDLLSAYQPHRAGEVIISVQRRSASTGLLYDLLVGESALVNELLRLAGFGNRPRREQTKIATTLFKNWDFHLRRMCTGHDLRRLGPELFEVATAALRAHQQAREPKSSPPEDGDSLLHESDFAERLGRLGLVEVCDSGLLMAIDERGPVRWIHELEGLPE